MDVLVSVLLLCVLFNMAASMDRKQVELGFIEKTDSWRLTSPYFPSKVGGKPSWLSLVDLPDNKKLACRNCNKPTIFLLQIYCPIDGAEETFHRTLFIFVCKDSACHSHNSHKPFLVFRSQLGRTNDFYDYEPLDEETEPSTDSEMRLTRGGVNLCILCGSNACNKKCSKCQTVFYCSREHQIIHWKAGHKNTCSKDDVKDSNTTSTMLFPESEIVIEPEPTQEQLSKEDKSELEVVATEEIDKGYSTKELENMALKETKDDKHFLCFKERIGLEPEQVLRYDLGGMPLWVSHLHQPTTTDIPPCQCGAKRIFEFQVMPQMLLHLNVDKLDASIDWGTLAVYTCESNCCEGEAYHEEFLWKQDYGQNPDRSSQES